MAYKQKFNFLKKYLGECIKHPIQYAGFLCLKYKSWRVGDSRLTFEWVISDNEEILQFKQTIKNTTRQHYIASKNSWAIFYDGTQFCPKTNFIVPKTPIIGNLINYPEFKTVVGIRNLTGGIDERTIGEYANANTRGLSREEKKKKKLTRYSEYDFSNELLEHLNKTIGITKKSKGPIKTKKIKKKVKTAK